MIASTKLFVCIIAIIASVPAFGQKKRNKMNNDTSKEVITYDSEGLKVAQEGSNNVVMVEQTDGETNLRTNKEDVLIEQNGNKIHHHRSLSEDDTSSTHTYNKTTNSADINQSGHGNSVKIKQRGKGNSVSISQGGKRRKEE